MGWWGEGAFQLCKTPIHSVTPPSPSFYNSHHLAVSTLSDFFHQIFTITSSSSH